VLDHFRHSSRARGNRHHFAGHAFQCRQAEGFQFARHQHHIGDRQLFPDLILLAEKQYVLVNALLHG